MKKILHWLWSALQNLVWPLFSIVCFIVIVLCALILISIIHQSGLKQVFCGFSQEQIIPIATLLILTITLFSLIKYTKDTARIANATEDNYYMPAVIFQIESQLFNSDLIILPTFMNLKAFACNAKLWLSIEINDVSYPCTLKEYNGTKDWYLGPNKPVNGRMNLNNHALKDFGIDYSTLFDSVFRLKAQFQVESQYKKTLGSILISYKWNPEKKQLIYEI